MARIFGVDIPNAKRTVIALTYIKGIGHTTAQKIVSKLNLDANKHAKDLTQDEIEKGVQAYLKRTNQFPYNKKAIEKAEKTRQTRRERVEREKNLMQLEDTTDE